MKIISAIHPEVLHNLSPSLLPAHKSASFILYRPLYDDMTLR
jgi:hypothetical protein